MSMWGWKSKCSKLQIDRCIIGGSKLVIYPQVAKSINGGHKKNVWEIMRCPEYVLKCNKSVHLPARVSFLCLLGDLWVIWERFALRALWEFTLQQIAPKPPTNQPKDITKTLKRVSEHFYWTSIHIRDIISHTFFLPWLPVIYLISTWHLLISFTRLYIMENQSINRQSSQNQSMHSEFSNTWRTSNKWPLYNSGAYWNSKPKEN